MRIPKDTERVDVVVLLKGGESVAPVPISCINPFCRHSLIAKVNREVALTLQNSKGVHWADLSPDITMIQHKCRACRYFYKIYTPSTVEQEKEAKTIMEGKAVV